MKLFSVLFLFAIIAAMGGLVFCQGPPGGRPGGGTQGRARR